MNNYENYYNYLKSIRDNLDTNNIKYERVFNNRGVYGIVGYSKITFPCVDTKCQRIIYKIGNNMNRNLIHENLVLESLNNMKEYCPHFVYCFGKKLLNINEDFMYEPFTNEIETDDITNTIPREIIYLEELDKYPVYKFIKNADKNNICSQLLQLLMALEISQNQCSLTHYDLHMGNILIQKCNPDTLFMYKINGQVYCVPTYGYYPVIIDTGISYSDNLNGNQMCSNTDSYDYGFQSTLFDKLNDSHHLLLSIFYEIEIRNDCFDTMSTKIKKLFRHLPVLTRSGWKKLPFDITDIVLDRLRECSNYKDLILFREYKQDMLELLNGLITLPLQDYGDGDLNCFSDFILELQNIIDYDEFVEKFSDNELLYCVKKIIDIIHDSTHSSNTISSNSDCINKIKNICSKYISFTEYSSDINNITDTDESEFVDELIIIRDKSVNWIRLINSAKKFGKALSTNYYRLRSKHQELIDYCYRKTIVKTPIDIFNYLARNLTPNYYVDSDNTIEFWNIDDKTHTKHTIHLNPEQITTINTLPFGKKGEELWKLIR